MSDEVKSKSWWYTLPGIITGLTAAITALTGLVVAVRQTGWFGPQSPPAVTVPAGSIPSGSDKPAAPAAPNEGLTRGNSYQTHLVTLPAMRDYKLGEATFTLLKAEVLPQTTEKEALQIRLRMTNHGRFDTNFWDRSFRLVVDGVPVAPGNTLNELVPGQSAKEGDVMFVLPRGTTAARLKITYNDDSTEISLNLASLS